MNTRTHAELANFIWSICNLLRSPYKLNEYRKVIPRPLEEIEADPQALEREIAEPLSDVVRS